MSSERSKFVLTLEQVFSVIRSGAPVLQEPVFIIMLLTTSEFSGVDLADDICCASSNLLFRFAFTTTKIMTGRMRRKRAVTMPMAMATMVLPSMLVPPNDL